MPVRTLRDKLDTVASQLNAKIDGVASQLTTKIDSVKDSLAAAKIWALVLYIALAATMLGTMARGFGWL